MSTYSILSSLDGISTPPLKGKYTSWLGCLGSLGLLALCLAIYIPAAISYFAGTYYQSMFNTNSVFKQPLYSRDDFKLAIVVRSKQNGSAYNHETIVHLFQAYLYYDNLTTTFKEPLQACDRQYFVGDINGVALEDCLTVPDYVQFNPGYLSNKFASMSMVISPPAFSNPFRAFAFIPTQQQVIFADLLANYYCQFYFTSKVVTDEGKIQFQLHRAYSTEINVASNTLGASITVMAGLRTTLMDNSIMPWRNYKNITLMSYASNHQGTSLNLQTASNNGVQQALQLTNSMEVAVRYYKKLDWLLGIIGGGIFLFFVFFWVFFNFYNRNAARFDLVQQLLLLRTTNDYPRSEEELIPVRIPLSYMLRRLIPFARVEQYEKLLEESENYNDIALFIKKMKVAQRNLKRKGLLS